MLKKILAASVLTIALAGSALAQTNGTGAGGTAGTGNGTGTGTVGSGGAAGTGSGNAAVPTDPNSTNSTTKSNGMTDRCKDAAGNDIDNNTASGATTSTVQNCNK
ncbi:hypothetical protein NKH47_10850 [Mesorhizobium sp. M1060]|uniref:hypothetical protein n=1 Tax=unclassified Mesorhizobium TaxID=325217 RepID=UPI0004CE81BD|nr:MULTISPECIES: hypothetical protein [unclassified Mesorhizobium]WJI53561.1 hypothetical protein NLY44_13310 [Mesorhizobium sp. C089B]